MLSRIADSLYWMARYLERVDDTARLIEIFRGRLPDCLLRFVAGVAEIDATMRGDLFHAALEAPCAT